MSISNSKLGDYLQCAHYTDKQVGTFIDKLDKHNLLENTVIMFFGDHEGIHKFYPEEIEKIKFKESWWFENHKRIPLLIYQKKNFRKRMAQIVLILIQMIDGKD